MADAEYADTEYAHPSQTAQIWALHMTPSPPMTPSAKNLFHISPQTHGNTLYLSPYV